MKKIALFNTFSGIVHVVFTVDGVERFRDSHPVNAASLKAPHDEWVSQVGEAVGVVPWDIRGALYDLETSAVYDVAGDRLVPWETQHRKEILRYWAGKEWSPE